MHHLACKVDRVRMAKASVVTASGEILAVAVLLLISTSLATLIVMRLIPTIGLEVHAELKTATKMFCNSKNDADESCANVNVCPVCMAHPGTLPVINKTAVKHVLRVGTAVGGTLADYTEFDRKNYFYPDLPKGYQLSQYEHPLVSGGSLCGIKLTRIHLEEDTARSQHDLKSGATLVDYNRAGVPLMELVTEPMIHSAEDAGNFARELRLLLRYLGVGDANMEKGEMRVEANVSVAPEGKLGTKVEIKNLNSFRSVEHAVAFEIARQTKLIEKKGWKVVQETRGWDETAQHTFTQRLKEGSADYRYFPDPDLPKLVLSEIEGYNFDAIQKGLPELPSERRKRYLNMGLVGDDANLYVEDTELGAFYDLIVAAGKWSNPEALRLASNYVATDLIKIIRDSEKQETFSIRNSEIKAEYFAELITLILDKKISSRAAKDILAIMFMNGGAPSKIAEERGLFQKGGEALLPIVKKVIENNAAVAAYYKAGKVEALQFLIGQGMKESRGSANPQELRELLVKELRS